MIQLKSQAIQTALVGDWNNAINLNQLILQEDPDDIDTLNRLAFAFLSLGNTKDAKTLYEKVLMLDMKNPIALRNLKRLGDTQNQRSHVMINNLFIEEPGKTKVIELINVADKKFISHLRSGEMLELRIKRNKIFALDMDKQYMGMLPDDICQRLINFIDGGNQYEAYVRTVDNNRVIIFIREKKRVKRFRDQPSFILNDKVKLSLENNTLTIRSSGNSSSKNQSTNSRADGEESL